MNHGSIPCVHPPATQSMRRRFRIAEVAAHDHVATGNDLAHGLAVVRYFAAIGVYYSQLPRRNQFDSLTRFDGGTLLRRKHIMLRARFADRDEGRGLCHAVDVRNFPAQFSFDALNGSRSGRCPRSEDANATASITAHFFGCVSQTDQHGWGGTEDGDALLLYQSEYCLGIDFAQANVCRANCSDRPHKSPSVRVKHCRVQRYLSAQVIGKWSNVPTTFM